MKLWLRLLALLMVVCMMMGCLAACGEDENQKQDDDAGIHEEENEEENKGEEEDKGDDDGLVQDELYGLRFDLPAGMIRDESKDHVRDYENDHYRLLVTSGPGEGVVTSVETAMDVWLEGAADGYEFSEIRYADGVPYIYSVVTENTYEITCFYYYAPADYGWRITYTGDFGPDEELLIACATSGVIDENYDFESLLGDYES